MTGTELLAWGAVAHLVADWLFQNEWMAVNKVSLRHPAAWVHSGIHLALLGAVFPWGAAVALAASHLLIDTRIPRQWWSKTLRQTEGGEMGLHVAIWVDQVMHLAAIAAVAAVTGAA